MTGIKNTICMRTQIEIGVAGESARWNIISLGWSPFAGPCVGDATWRTANSSERVRRPPSSFTHTLSSLSFCLWIEREREALRGPGSLNCVRTQYDTYARWCSSRVIASAALANYSPNAPPPPCQTTGLDRDNFVTLKFQSLRKNSFFTVVKSKTTSRMKEYLLDFKQVP